jgi:hypothetical protein
MFQGELGKKMMIQQGYVPPTCTLPVELAGPLIWSEVNAGRDVCAGCEADRSVCHGRPKTPNANMSGGGNTIERKTQRAIRPPLDVFVSPVL